MLGNPISVVRGVVVGAVDLFYEPIKVLPCFLALPVSIVLHFFLHMCREVSLDLKSFLKGWALALGASLGQELLVSNFCITQCMEHCAMYIALGMCMCQPPPISFESKGVLHLISHPFFIQCTVELLLKVPLG